MAGFRILLFLLLACPTGLASAREWTEADFATRELQDYRFIPANPDGDSAQARTVIGSLQVWKAERGDTFLDIGRSFDLGLNTMKTANPGVDEWIPHTATGEITIPTAWILPCCTYEGVVVNLPEMRLYWYPKTAPGEARMVYTFPVGLGRQEWRTPLGKFEIIGKTRNPTWVIPQSILKERIRENGSSEPSIAGGRPDNPLGAYRLRLSLPSYAIHGTNIPWGVGMSVSHGCVRMYPEDIHEWFPLVPNHTSGEFVYQTIKAGLRDGRVLLEVHPDLYGLSPGPWREAMRVLQQQGLADRIDAALLLRAVKEKLGYPVDITKDLQTRPTEKPSPPETIAEEKFFVTENQ